MNVLQNGLPIYVDFSNADADGFVRLNCSGTLRDVAASGLSFFEGMEILVHDGEIQTTGTVRKANYEGAWLLEVNWREILEKHSKL